ncbi:MAG: ABC transporter substrate-binding protein [Methanothrix sp.]|nr:ABC transporter substrate-binding protein [Methanothrix sp.]
MRNMIPNTRITTARLAALLVLAALLGAGVQAAMAAENTLNISIGTVKSLSMEYTRDPTLSDSQFPETGGQCRYHRYTHLAQLITLDGDGKVIPWLAESYEVSDDYKTITFHLRKGVRFADGKAYNASVAKYNLDRIITYGWNGAFGSNGTMGANPLFVNYDSTEVIDDQTIRIHFSHGWLTMPQEFASLWHLGYVISPEDVVPAWDIKGTWTPKERYNGLGPYSVDENESIPKQKIVLKKRNSWYDDLDFHKPKMDKITFIVIADPQTRVLALNNGEIDYIYRYWNPPFETLPELRKNSNDVIDSRPNTMMYILATSWWKAPFNGTDGIKLRKALSHALDRNELVKGAFYGYALPATDSVFLSPLLPEFPDCCLKGYDLDLDKAKQLFEEAGWKDTDGDGILDKGGQPLKLRLLITSSDSLDYSWQKDTALVIQSQLKKVGVDIQIQDLEYGAYKDEKKKENYDLIFAWSFPRYNSLVTQLANDFSLQSSLSLKNYYENQNQSLRSVVESARSATSEDERNKYVCQACQVLYDDAGVIPLVYQMEFAVMSKKVKGFQFGAHEFLDRLEECWIEK